MLCTCKRLSILQSSLSLRTRHQHVHWPEDNRGPISEALERIDTSRHKLIGKQGNIRLTAGVYDRTGSNQRKRFLDPSSPRDMAWLWAPHDLFRDAGHCTEGTNSPRMDWMKVYLLFDSVTARPYGMSGVYMGLANRRRIWDTCEELKRLYVVHVAKTDLSLTKANQTRHTWSLDSEIDML
jgi:hypothetical protein